MLAGGPISGAIIRDRGGLVGLRVFVAVMLGGSGICSLAARFFKVGLKVGVKVYTDSSF